VIERDDENVYIIPPDASGSRAELGQRYQNHQAALYRQMVAEEPQYVPADQRSWLGGKKESPEVRQHNQRLRATHWAKVEANFIRLCGLELDYHGVRDTARAAAAMSDVLQSLPRGSFEHIVVEQVAFDGADRMRALSSEVVEDFLRRVAR